MGGVRVVVVGAAGTCRELKENRVPTPLTKVQT